MDEILDDNLDMELRAPRGAYTSKVDQKGRLKLPTVFQEALGQNRTVLVISLLEQSVRIYPIGGSSSQQIELGVKPSGGAARKKTEWIQTRSAILGFGGIHYPLWCIVEQPIGFVTEIDSQGRVLIAPGLNDLSAEANMANQEVRMRWIEDHLVVITEKNERDHWPPTLWWIA